MNYLLLLIGFALLVKGADYFVDGASSIARTLRVPALLIGLTIVAFGTSSPEAAVSISAALKGNNGIAVGNVLGSNIFNMTFIVGLAALFYPLTVERQTIRKEIPIMLLSAFALLALGADTFLAPIAQTMTISRGDGLMLLLLFAVFLYYIFEVAANSRETVEIEDKHPNSGIKKMLLYTLGGLTAIVVGGNFVVDSSIAIAKSFGLSETLIGLTIVAVGTSLPELVTSVVASMKKQSDIAVGNIVGSNIFNVLFILGISAVISPITIDSSLILELGLNIGLTVLLLGFSKSKYEISKKEGIVLCLAYVAYTGYLVSTVM